MHKSIYNIYIKKTFFQVFFLLQNSKIAKSMYNRQKAKIIGIYNFYSIREIL